MSIEDCEQVNREIGTILDVEDPLPFTYTLEVSSPGLDRPLRDPDDYRRFAGRLAKVVVREPVDNQKAFEGRLGGVDQDDVLLDAANGRRHRLPLRLITRGRLEGQAPDIDPLVYLTDCDPSALSPGQFVQAEIVASRGYDLVVRPFATN